jgi:nonsense-mediated mRNA decay protein 3
MQKVTIFLYSGFLIANSNFNNELWDSLRHKKGEIQDVILVRKSYPNARKRQSKRNWKLNKIVKEEEENNRAKGDKVKNDMDYELFLRDIEEDEELRGMVNLYKSRLFLIFRRRWRGS